MLEEEKRQTFLLLHVDRYNSFIVPELQGLLNNTKEEYTIYATKIEGPIKYTVITTSFSTIDYILSKSMLVSRAIKILNFTEYGKADKKAEEPSSIVDKLSSSLTADVLEFLKKEVKGDYKIECICNDKIQAIEHLVTSLGMQQNVNLSNPAHSIYVVEESCFCIVGVLYKESNRKQLLKYSVKNRQFIGNTSMDNEISFIICNASGVSDKTVLLDCYAGSGSILLSGAIHGSLVVGTDINSKQFKGRDIPHTNSRIKTQLPNTSIHSNFKMYNVADKVLMIGAQNVFDGCIFRDSTVDVILCDPPYGERETVKKRATDSNKYVEGCDQYLLFSIPFLDRAIEMGKKVLKNRGRIGIFLPHATGHTPQLKEMEGVRKVSQSEQFLNALYSRTFFLLEIIK
ncbi:tRNA (guanine10-N2)-methyltransferase [Nematocida minor]|uniref:tRNA (guanine10-N2)-methyltransferase n=1 Tax=Nematocida minor TaxID=1912983 RepID=UPI00221FCDA6|nr:tRNA (guanine10-N2)-methyltransferase [Nematocida minor]KAI5193027.1 tRNA (guanine10-N2)-methyltransferase [Nematocida minor]